MPRRQAGLTLTGLFVALFIIVFVALLAMKLIPAYIEYKTAKSAIQSIVRERDSASPSEVRRAFDARAQIDNIEAVKSTDLEITKDRDGLTIAFAYRKEIPLFANLGVYIDFEANTQGK